MKPIKIKSTGLAIVSTFFTLIGAIGYCAAKDENAKTASLIIGFSSAATGIVSVTKSQMDERDVNEKLNKIVEQLNSEKQLLDKRIITITEDNNRLQMSNSALNNDCKNLAESLERSVQDKNKLSVQLTDYIEQINQKERSIIEIQTSKDERFDEFLKEFLAKLIDKLYDHCSAYSRIETNIRSLLENEDYKNIHSQLERFLVNILEECQYHLEKINELRAYDTDRINSALAASLTANELMNHYHKVVEEICAVRVRYRNLLNTDERLALKEWEEMRPYLIKKPDAIKSVRAQADYDKQILQELNKKVEEHGKAIHDDMTAMLYDLEKANERVAELSKPIMWKIAPNQTSQVGNAIILYAKSRGIHLDRSHYEGDIYSAKLYFFYDRINPAATVDLKALSEDADKIAQNMHLLEPVKFSYDYDSRLIVAEITMEYRQAEAKKKLDPVAKVHEFRKPAEALITFIQEASHIGLWGQTKAGKTTAISNIVGGMVQELGGAPKIRLTIPKIEAETQKLFPVAHWIGVDESIFGLLEAALEIQYRLEKNKQAYRAKEIIQDFEPVLYFIDEINLIFRRWRSICEDDMIGILDKFEGTLDGERLNYFRETMRTELINYKGQFSSRLLLFIWQTGRSLKVKSLIAGQNLMPNALGFNKTDLENCSYIMMGRSIKKGMEYKVDDVDLETISNQHNTLKQALKSEPNLQYTALYSPAVGEAYFGILPPPNYYKWDADIISVQLSSNPRPTASNVQPENRSKMPETQVQQDLDGDKRLKRGLSTSETEPDTSNDKGCKVFVQVGHLPEKYQNLDFKGYSDLLDILPKKADGSVHRTEAYKKVFNATRSDSRKLYSDFIDWLEMNFK